MLIVFAILSGIAIAVFLVVVLSTRKPPLEYEEYVKTGYAIRRRWFLGLLLSLIAIFILMVPFFPYMTTSEAMASGTLKVKVQTFQFAFLMPDQLPLNKKIILKLLQWMLTTALAYTTPRAV